MKSKVLKITFLIILMIIILTKCTYIQAIDDIQYIVMDNIDYNETLEEIKNPERGFYSTAFLRMMPSGTKATNSRANLVHLRVDIGNFSGAVNGTGDLEFTDDALNALDQTFANIRSNGGSVIIRFAYDGFNGKANLEPSLDMILKHISQLKPIFEKNKDVLAYVELGFFGPWGEMHTSKVSSTDNVSKGIDAMLDTVPETIKIGVRTPNYYVKWLGIDRKTLNENITQKGTDAYRVGLYNDGYLGSESDLGTFANREIEVAWLENQAMHTLYGGEVVANYASKTPLNTVEYMSKEAFKTHTTYLNSEWNNTVIDAWKNETYNGDDKIYAGQSGYTYISNHLGYRFVLKKSEVVDKIEKDENLKIKLQIENVGFANLINDKIVTVVLENDGKKYEIPTNINATTWNSKETTNVNIEVPLPEDIDLGKWNIYLRISQNGDMNTDNNYKCIKFANSNIWEENFCANYIGNVTISEVTQKDTNEDDNNNTQNNENQNDNVNENDNNNTQNNENQNNNVNENDNNNTQNNGNQNNNVNENDNNNTQNDENQNNNVNENDNNNTQNNGSQNNNVNENDNNNTQNNGNQNNNVNENNNNNVNENDNNNTQNNENQNNNTNIQNNENKKNDTKTDNNFVENNNDLTTVSKKLPKTGDNIQLLKIFICINVFSIILLVIKRKNYKK